MITKNILETPSNHLRFRREICFAILTTILVLIGSLNSIANPGDLDPSFGANGKVLADLGGDNRANAVTVQSSGKIIAAGYAGDDFAVARLNANGVLDASFGSNGRVTTDFGQVEVINAVAIQPDNRIIAVGSRGFQNSPTSLAMARYNSDGSLDPSFGSGGRVTLSDDVQLIARAVILQPDGKIVVIGGDVAFVLARFNPNGTLDSGFGNGGTVRINFNGDRDFAKAYGATIQPNGKITVVGRRAIDPFNFPIRPQLCVARFNPNGSLDTGFDGDGLLTDRGSMDIGFSVAARPNGKVIVVGAGSLNFKLAQYNDDGTLDSAFGSGGRFAVDFGGRADDAKAIVNLPDGKFAVAGTSQLPVSTNTEPDFAIAQFKADGTIDQTFGSGGLVRTDVGGEDAANALAAQSDGKLIAAGFSQASFNQNGKFAVARYFSSAAKKTNFDFDGDRKADYGVFRPASGVWFLQQSQAGFAAAAFGIASDRIVPADYDGDGKTDIAVFRDGIWYRLNSSNNAFAVVQFGQAGDLPQAGDFDGDGRADQVVFRSGVWYLNRSTAGFAAAAFGIASDKPVAADYDGDGKTDVAVYRDGLWYSLRSSDGQFTAVSFGQTGDVAVAADYDGDGKTDQGVFRQGNWFINRSSQGFTGISWGLATDKPVPADYDGDGKTDVAVYRAGIWYLFQSTAGFAAQTFGQAGDLPTPNAFIR